MRKPRKRIKGVRGKEKKEKETKSEVMVLTRNPIKKRRSFWNKGHSLGTTLFVILYPSFPLPQYHPKASLQPVKVLNDLEKHGGYTLFKKS